MYDSGGWITNLRVSPDGNQAAFLEHPIRDDDGGYVRVVDRKGVLRNLTPYWSSVLGLAWSPSGNEVWFTASKIGALRWLYAVSRAGMVRLIANPPSSLRLMDISRDGRVLLVIEELRTTLKAALADEAGESDRTKFDHSHADDISADGHLLLFTEDAVTAGKHYTAFLYDSRSGETTRLAEGRGLAISPDAKWGLTIDPEDRHALALRQIPSGAVRVISGRRFEYQWARFLRTSEELLVGGRFPGDHLMLARQKVGGELELLQSLPYLDDVVVSPDGSKAAGNLEGEMNVIDLNSRSVQRLVSGQPLMPIAWSADGLSVYALKPQGCNGQLLKLSLTDSKASLWRTISVNGTPGFAGLASMVAAPEAKAYAYSVHLSLSRLYVVDGWA